MHQEVQIFLNKDNNFEIFIKKRIMKTKFIIMLLIIVVHSTTSFSQWTQIALSTYTINNFVIGGVSSELLFAGTSSHGVYVTNDYGATWLPSNGTILSTSNVYGLATNGSTILAGNTTNGLSISTNDGIDWLPVSGMTTRVNSMTNTNSIMYAGANNSGLFKSTNNGINWSAINNGLPSSTSQILALHIRSSKIYAGVSGQGVYVSTDNGNSWSATNNANLTNKYVNTISSNSSRIFVGTLNGLFASDNDGATWSLIGLSGRSVQTLYVNGNTIFAGVTSSFQHFLISSDNGQTWFDANTGLPSTFDVLTLAVFGTNLYLGSGAGIWSRPLNTLILPENAGIVSGDTIVCRGQNSVIYTVDPIPYATSYLWTLPTGATGTSNTHSIVVNYGNSAISGNITVKGHNSVGNGTLSTLPITVNYLPANAGAISGLTNVCSGQGNVVYSVSPINYSTSYVWTIPSGASGSSIINNITLNYNTTAGSDFLSVQGSNSCGIGSPYTIGITINTPTTPIITLNGNILQSSSATGNQWYNQNGLISGATGQNYTTLINGDYYVIVTLLGCSSDTSNILNVIITGIEVAENNKHIKVYPNPASNELIIEANGNNETINFEIYNSVGQLVFKGSLLNKTIVQTGSFATGVYMIKLDGGKTFEFKKIIKE